jgi:hypothetical protein
MSPARHPAETARALHSVAAELDQVAREVGAVEARVSATIGSTATGADRRMLAGLYQASNSTRGAQQALSAAARSLRDPRP